MSQHVSLPESHTQAIFMFEAASLKSTKLAVKSCEGPAIQSAWRKRGGKKKPRSARTGLRQGSVSYGGVFHPPSVQRRQTAPVPEIKVCQIKTPRRSEDQRGFLRSAAAVPSCSVNPKPS